jgi:alpha-galactosidase
MKRLLCALAAGCCGLAMADSQVWLDELNLGPMSSGWNKPQAKKSVDGHQLTIKGKGFERGVGTHAESFYVIETGGNALTFEAEVGIDDEVKTHTAGSVVFKVYSDKKVAADSGIMRPNDPPKKIKADIAGSKLVILEVMDAGDGVDSDHGDWANAFFTVKDGAKLTPTVSPQALTTQFGILTPPESPKPRINGAAVFGVRPTHPILYTLAVSGKRPMKFAAAGVPEGASFDTATGRLTGSVAKAGTYPITFTAENELGKATREFKLIVGDTIALTPPMGWNSWNCFAGAVSDAKIRAAADAMVKSGLINHGWSYVNIDDYWQNKPSAKNDQTLQGPERDANGKIVPNKRFPDMKALADYVHGLGLKIGLYSSPGPYTCGGCTGSWQHEMQDAQTYAEWGFDYLKYDWCSYGGVNKLGNGLKGLMHPYFVMGRALHAQNRDIVHSLCQYGMGNVSTWGRVVNGQSWRTTGDITDTWGSMIQIADAQDGLGPFAGPGTWNDPDMLIVGKVGWGNLHPTRLTPNEQYTHISLWCLFCSPLLIGCDMTQFDAFTLSLLTNDEVLEVSQDPLGNGADRIYRSPDKQYDVWAKHMSDGSLAVGLVNLSYTDTEATFNFKDAEMDGTYRLRDLWRQADIGDATSSYKVTLPGHATQLIRCWKK